MKFTLPLLTGSLLLIFSTGLYAQHVTDIDVDPPPEWALVDNPGFHDAPPVMDDGDIMPFDQPEPPPVDEGMRLHREGPPDEHSPVTQWLDHLQKNNPDEFERMKQMMKEDPGQFHALLRNRVQQQRMKQALKSYPPLLDAYQTLNAQEQKDLIDMLYKPPHQRKQHNREARKQRRQNRERNTQNKPFTELEKETRNLAKTFHQTDNEEQQQIILIELREKLEQLFDLRNEERLAHIENLEKKIAALKERMELRDARRNDIVDRRLDELTQNPDLKW